MYEFDDTHMKLVKAEIRLAEIERQFYNYVNSHLTKREQFAMAAMQGLLHNVTETERELACVAVSYADALIEELEK